MFRQFLLFVLILTISFSLFGCTEKSDYKNVDYSQYPFTDISWTRQGENDVETIRFGSDGSYSYSCGCGNPVNDSDLNDGYTYDDTTKTIMVRYIETTEDTISTIKIKKCDDETLKLDFEGEIREFVIGLS